jgi:carboxypeptidase Q
MHRFTLLFAVTLLVGCQMFAQPQRMPPQESGGEQIDTVAINKIIDEGTTRSKVMETLSWLTDVYGPRLTASPGFRQASEWARNTLTSWGLQNVHFESCGMFGRGWSLKKYSAHLIGKQVAPLLSYPKAWSPGTSGDITAEAIYLDAQTDSALETFRGKLRGKFVLLGDPVTMRDPFLPDATRDSDSTLLALANAGPRRDRFRRPGGLPDRRQRALIEYRQMMMCQEEHAVAILTP